MKTPFPGQLAQPQPIWVVAFHTICSKASPALMDTQEEQVLPGIQGVGWPHTHPSSLKSSLGLTVGNTGTEKTKPTRGHCSSHLCIMTSSWSPPVGTLVPVYYLPSPQMRGLSASVEAIPHHCRQQDSTCFLHFFIHWELPVITSYQIRGNAWHPSCTASKL